MMRAMFTLIAVVGMAMAINAQTTMYRLAGSTAQMWDGAVWQNLDSSSYQYSIAEQDTLLQTFIFDNLNFDWDKSSKSYKTFDAHGNLTQNLVQVWDGTVFTNYQKSDYTYNSQHLRTSYTRYTWDGIDWVPDFRSTYTFNVDGQTTSYLREEFVSGSWENYQRNIYTYSNGFLEVSEEQLWVSGNWQKQRRSVYTNDANGNVVKHLGQNWVAPAFENNYMYLRTYDANNNMLTDAYIDWVSGGWDSITRTVYKYNDSNQSDTILYQEWYIDPFNPGWLSHTREVRVYNGLGLLDSIKTQEPAWGTWVTETINSYQYDANGNNTMITVINNDWGTWVNQYRYYSYYEAYTLTDIEQLDTDLAVVAYPNPFTDKLYFHLSDVNTDKVEVTLFDISGKRILYLSPTHVATGQPLSIDASNLPHGQYVYWLTVDGVTSRGLVVK